MSSDYPPHDPEHVINMCPKCWTLTGAPKWDARYTTLWANQYGQCIRIFCKKCGQWTDRKHLRNSDEIISRVVKQS